jgi:hypothetical protein
MKPTRVAAIILAAFLSTGSAFATTVISSLPFTASKAGETYLVAAGLPPLASGNAINISADGVTIDGQNNTITYAVSGTGKGIVVGYSPTTFTIKNVILVHGAYVPQANEFDHAIEIDGNKHNYQILNNNVTLRNAGTVASTFMYGIWHTDFNALSTGNVISGNTFNISGQSAAKAIYIDAQTGDTQPWNGTIDHNTINLSGVTSQPAGRSGGIEAGIATVTGTINNNSIYMDPTVFETGGITLYGCNGWSVMNNTIHVSGYYSRAVLLDGSNSNVISYNTITYDSAPSTTVASDETSSGIRLRFSSSYNVVSNNNVDTTGYAAVGIRIGGTEPVPGHTTRPSGNVITSNTFQSATRAVTIEEGADTSFVGNTITNTSPAGIAIYVYDTTGTPNIHFNGDKISGFNTSLCGTTNCLVLFASNVSNFTFCGIPISQSQITALPGMTINMAINATCPPAPSAPSNTH